MNDKQDFLDQLIGEIAKYASELKKIEDINAIVNLMDHLNKWSISLINSLPKKDMPGGFIMADGEVADEIKRQIDNGKLEPFKIVGDKVIKS